MEDWQNVYEREMKIVGEEGATTLYGDNEGMSPHLKAANLAQQNIIRLQKLLKDSGDSEEKSPLEEFLDATN